MNSVTHNTHFLVELRTSIEASTVTWALVLADYQRQDRPMPEKLADLHHDERRKYEDAAVLALMLVNRDAEVYAQTQAWACGYAELEQFVKDHSLDWLDDGNPINDGDALEMLAGRLARKAVQRFRQVLTGVYPGLSAHLAKREE